MFKHYSKWIALLTVIVLFFACYNPWVLIPSKNLLISGINTAGTLFGKPAYLHFIFAGIYIIINFIPHIGLKRFNILIAAINLGWALKNFLLMSACLPGECPIKLPGIWLTLITSIALLLLSFFPDVKMDSDNYIN